jgi:hypothetical protein
MPRRSILPGFDKPSGKNASAASGVHAARKEAARSDLMGLYAAILFLVGTVGTAHNPIGQRLFGKSPRASI